MVRSLIALTVLAGVSVAAAPALAQDRPQTAPAPAPALQASFAPPSDARIAFVSLQTVFTQSKLGQAGQKQMQALQAKQAADLEAQTKAIEALQREIQAQAGVLAPDALQAKQSQLDKATRALQFARQEAQAAQDSLNQQLLENFRERLQPVLQNIQAERGLWAIFSKEDPGVLISHPALDLSAEVLKRLDADQR